MADHGKMYFGLGHDIIDGMRKISSKADYVLPNITEACFLTGTQYQEEQTDKFIKEDLLKGLKNLGAKNVILTGFEKDGKIGAIAYDGKSYVYNLKERQPQSYHGTGDIFSSIIIANIMQKQSMDKVLDDATDFVVDAIKNTVSDKSHNYGVKYEEVLYKRRW